MESAWETAKARLVSLFPDARERGHVRHALLSLDLKLRLEYFKDTDEAVRAALEALTGGIGPTAQTANALTAAALRDVKAFVTETMTKMTEVVQDTAVAMTETVAVNTKLLGQVLMDRVLEYVNLSSTCTSTLHQDSFRAAVAEHYGVAATDRAAPVQCMVTGCLLDWHDVVAGHIVPRAQYKAARRDILLHDINDPRNGLLWCRPLEAAWSQGLFCFASPEPDVFLFTLLDSRLYHQRLQDWAFSKKPLKRSSAEALGDLTWGELHNTAEITFSSTGRPYKRALSLMATVFLLNASSEHRDLPEGVDPLGSEFSYASDDSKTESTVAWLQAAAGSCYGE